MLVPVLSVPPLSTVSEFVSGRGNALFIVIEAPFLTKKATLLVTVLMHVKPSQPVAVSENVFPAPVKLTVAFVGLAVGLAPFWEEK